MKTNYTFLQKNRISKTVLLLGFMFFGNETLATIKSEVGCPEKFIGTVVEVSDPQAPFKPERVEKVKVTFKTIKSLKKTEEKYREIILLKNGPEAFSEGDVYQVELRDRWICSLQKLK